MGKDILIVDEDVVAACALARVLRGRHSVRIVFNLSEAMAQITHRRPDTVICANDLLACPAEVVLNAIGRDWPGIQRLVLSRPFDLRELLGELEVA